MSVLKIPCRMLAPLLLLLLINSLRFGNCATNSSDEDEMINGQALALPSGGFMLFLSNQSIVNTTHQDGTSSSPPSSSSSSELNPDELYPHRIIGGKLIAIRQAPWQVAILRNGRLFCGGSIIAPRWVLTAAHCVYPGGRYWVRAGSRFSYHGGYTRTAGATFIPRQYKHRYFAYDIGLIKVTRKFRFGPNVRPIKLAYPGWKLPRKFSISGWGLTNENYSYASKELRRVEIRKVSHSKCVRAYHYDARISDRVICAAAPGRDACSGDSGGPLVNSRRQYGVVSFGDGCAHIRYPGVYTDVRHYRQFIDFVMNNN